MAKKKKNVRDKKKDSLVEYGERFFIFAQKHSVLIIAAVFAIVIGLLFLYRTWYNVEAEEVQARDEAFDKLRSLGNAESAAEAQIILEDFQTIRNKNKGGGIYPEISLLYARACRVVGLTFDDDELLRLGEEACLELLEKHPKAPVTQLKHPETGENVVAFLLEDIRRIRRERASPEMEANFDPDDIYVPEPPPEDGANDE